MLGARNQETNEFALKVEFHGIHLPPHRTILKCVKVQTTTNEVTHRGYSDDTSYAIR